MEKQRDNSLSNKKTIFFILIPLTVAVFFLAYFSIKESRADSLQLLVIQGEAFIESLSSASKNAISSEEFYTQLAHKRYNEITIEIEQYELDKVTEDLLYRHALLHNLYSAHVFNTDSTLVASSFARGSQIRLPEFVVNEVQYLLSNREDNYLLLLDDDNPSGDIRHYYIKLSNKMDRVTVVVVDARYFTNALEQTQIGFLARQMTSDNSIEYIIYQATDGIVFSSLDLDGLLSIESDPFLTEAIESDSIMHRIHTMDDVDLLEIVRPFSTSDYPFGLLRIGLSLDDYNSISRRFDLQMILFSAGLLLLLIVSIVYLSSRKKRQRISAQYDQYKSVSDKIFDEMKTGVAAVDKDGYIIVVNKAFEEILEVQNLSDKNWTTTIAPLMPKLPKADEIHSRVIELEIKFVTHKLEKILLVVMSSLSSQGNQDNSFVAVINDVTNLRELEKKTARKERLSEMGDLAAGVAHEIRNPLNTISIASQRLAGEFMPSENQDEYLSFTKQIKDETKRLNEIITKFLALARGEKKQKSKIDMSEIVGEFCQFIAVEAESLGIKIEKDIAPPCQIEGNKDAVKQVLANLYNNSKESLNSCMGIIKLTIHTQQNKIELIFEDSGPGIPEEIREKIFTPYYTTKEAGTGLGLPTIHRIIADMGGEVKVETSDLGGAKFVISFS